MDYNIFTNNIQKSGFKVHKLDISYNLGDTRCWSVLLNPETDNIVITYNINRYELGTQLFDILSAKSILTDVEVEDIYDTLELLSEKYYTVASTEQE